MVKILFFHTLAETILKVLNDIARTSKTKELLFSF